MNMNMKRLWLWKQQEATGVPWKGNRTEGRSRKYETKNQKEMETNDWPSAKRRLLRMKIIFRRNSTFKRIFNVILPWIIISTYLCTTHYTCTCQCIHVHTHLRSRIRPPGIDGRPAWHSMWLGQIIWSTFDIEYGCTVPVPGVIYVYV